ncbi:cell wall / vacuolar inhibitor of fructosidase 2-like [Papaver somniferum]|uniref:cell wall / vacuolar inhibitor of fructosidase 2-like n=1 Tax=Papaver somniferum TaxID=3469 RepID=UPI000E6F54DF|nr:cell wall / vacuolar inhibitor of fructosidase 2-like [Papaver somniferum]
MALSVVYLISILSLVFIVHLGDAQSITYTCQFTAKVDLCTQILNADPSSEETDTAGRATVMLNAAMSDAVDTSRYILDELAKTYTDANAIRVVTECNTLYVNAKTRLETSIRDLYSDDKLGDTQDEVNAAAACAESCEKLFGTATPPLAYPDELERRQINFEDICGVANDIVGMLLV